MAKGLKITRKPNGMLTYRYDASREMSFGFHLISEVGQPWQIDAKLEQQRLRDAGYTIETRELDAYPWLADFAVKVEMKSIATAGEPS